MTLPEKEHLVQMAPHIKHTLEWMVADAIERNNETKPDNYSDDLQIAILCRDFMMEIVE